uniref:Uncharacterized protein n=1 Tax=Ananas comosus var. bracteatus TaxID=296719 RepID=A0A6V7PQW6_ANACO|nr:unnamed protein product [Ananas comosus var. bracteatus]
MWSYANAAAEIPHRNLLCDLDEIDAWGPQGKRIRHVNFKRPQSVEETLKIWTRVIRLVGLSDPLLAPSFNGGFRSRPAPQQRPRPRIRPLLLRLRPRRAPRVRLRRPRRSPRPPPPPPPLALPQPPPFSSSSSAAAAAGAGAGAWCFGDPEMRRRRRVASYKAYAAEGRVKATFRRGFRWIKEKCSEIIHGW